MFRGSGSRVTERLSFKTHNLNQFSFTCFLVVQHRSWCSSDGRGCVCVRAVVRSSSQTSSRNLFKKHFIRLLPCFRLSLSPLILNTSSNTSRLDCFKRRSQRNPSWAPLLSLPTKSLDNCGNEIERKFFIFDSSKLRSLAIITQHLRFHLSVKQWRC